MNLWSFAPTIYRACKRVTPSMSRSISDHEQKRALYMEAGIAEYWIVDAEARAITIVSRGRPARTEDREVHRSPPGAGDALVLPLVEVFG